MNKYIETQERYVISIPLPATSQEVSNALQEIREDWDRVYGGDTLTPDTIQVEAGNETLRFSFKGSTSYVGRV